MFFDVGAEFSDETIQTAWNLAGGKCEGCGKNLVWGNHQEGEKGAWEAHHIVAVKDGGKGTLDNCQILCLDCHKDTDSYGSH